MRATPRGTRRLQGVWILDSPKRRRYPSGIDVHFTLKSTRTSMRAHPNVRFGMNANSCWLMHHENIVPTRKLCCSAMILTMPTWAISNEPNSRKDRLGTFKKNSQCSCMHNHSLSRDAWPDVSRFCDSIMSICIKCYLHQALYTERWLILWPQLRRRGRCSTKAPTTIPS